jgi:cytochrome c oxidase subunit 4
MSETTETRDMGIKGYLAVWGALLGFTALTVTMASLRLGAIAIIVVLAVASAKSSLVLLYFMHLRNEKRVIIKILVPIVICLLAIFIGLTYTDILYR